MYVTGTDVQPNETGMMKFALHAAGYGTESGVPRTALTEGAKDWHASNGKSKPHLHLASRLPNTP